MRITAELLSQVVEQRMNPLGEQELVLRGLAIPAIENAAITRDLFDCWDLSNNRIVRLDNFSRLLRLSTLLCSDNMIDSIDMNNIQSNLPNLKVLSLAFNGIASLSDIESIGKACPKLEFLLLHGNPVARRPDYRLFTIHHIPSLKFLDYNRIKPTERDRARSIWSSSSTSTTTLAHQQNVHGSKNFEPGESDIQQLVRVGGGTGSTIGGGYGSNEIVHHRPRSFVSVGFTPEQKIAIRDMLSNAQSIDEVAEIEDAVRRGVMPKLLQSTTQQGRITRVVVEEEEEEEEVNKDGSAAGLNNNNVQINHDHSNSGADDHIPLNHPHPPLVDKLTESAVVAATYDDHIVNEMDLQQNSKRRRTK